MRLLLDTHVLIWSLNNDPQLSRKARELILDEDNTIYYSTASIWEISIKHSIHPDNVEFSGKQLSDFCAEAGFECIEIKDKHVYSLETIKREENTLAHNDPFDRIMLAQAKAEKMMLVTHDHLIPYYKDDCIIAV